MLPCFVDFHCHSTSSDGSLPPRELVQSAHRQGVHWMALTDHDTTAGLSEARAEAEALGMRFTNGIELSATWENGHCHILGYGFDKENPALKEAIACFQVARSGRIQKMVDKLGELGLSMSVEDLKIPPGTSAGRPHLAKAMVEKGFVPTMDEAFEGYLVKGAVAYVDKEIYTPQEVIQLIAQAGGFAVLAHPTSLRLKRESFLECLIEFKGFGLAGVEAYHSSHSRHQCNRLVRQSREAGLWAVGGSDYHGDAKPWVKMGRLKKGRKILSAWISPEFLEQLSTKS